MTERLLLKPLRLASTALLLLGALAASSAHAQDTVCAKVKIEIKQELTLERQAFDAEMKIHNTTDSGVIENVGVVVKVTDENGTPVPVTDNPNDLSAKFFLRISNKQAISDVDGNGVVNPKTTAVINWLLIPSPGAAGPSALGKKYLVGATLRYRFGGEDTTLDVSPDVITVKPLPLLTLDYFLPQDVWGDDPLTEAIEPIVPFTLGVRVKNTGVATAKSLKIDSAQPRIIENNQGLLINFLLTGSYVDDAPAQNTLLIDFGDIPGGSSKMGRWNMESSLAGRFTEFTARFSHADELGGALTSLMQATNTHTLIRDVRVDLPGRDMVKDYFAQDGDVLRVYESSGLDTEVIDRSGVATLVVTTGSGGNAHYRLSFPPTAGFSYVRLRDPFNGSKALGAVLRSDAKLMAADNVWLSKTRNPQSRQIEYWINFFDVNSSGSYDTEFQAPPLEPRPPVLQFIPERIVRETQQVSFMVEASSPDGKPVTLSAAPLPAGATFTQQVVDPQNPGIRRALFDWTPPLGSAGQYLVVYSATDGELSATRSAVVKVELDMPPPGPGTPALVAPLPGAQVTALKPTLSVQPATSSLDTTTQLQFEVYADEAMTQLLQSATVDKLPDAPGNGGGSVPQPTTWKLPDNLQDNSRYWWRVRAFDGALYSPWAYGRFFVNTFNDAPDSFNATSPVPNAEVDSATPLLSWTNSSDRDGDVLVYGVVVYRDAALTEVVAQVQDLPQGEAGSSSWTVPVVLDNHARYYWRVSARDPLGAQTLTAARPFSINTGNSAPTAPLIVSPSPGSTDVAPSTRLVVANASDSDQDLLTYVFEIDTVSTFDSSDKRSSGQLLQGVDGTTGWPVSGLLEDRVYWWRVKAQDAHSDSSWVIGDFRVSGHNEAPPTPSIRNPGNGAWSATLQPSLEANPVQDPEGAGVRYEFEIYRDLHPAPRVAAGSSDNGAWIVPQALEDHSTYWWRVRAVDERGAASAWSANTVLYVSTAPYQNPSIALTSPATITRPERVISSGTTRKLLTLRWEGTDPNIDPTVALYYQNASAPQDFNGTLIVDGLRQAAGTRTGSYVWDVTALRGGAYRIYALIYDSRGTGRAYAPGALIISEATPSGTLAVTAASPLRTSEDGQSASFTVRLGSAPTADVVVPLASSNPREGVTSPSSLTFTAQNWATPQTVTVTGQNDCLPDVQQSYQVRVGTAISLDPEYMSIPGAPVNAVNLANSDVPDSTSNPAIHICGMSIVSERRVDASTWEYVLRSELTNAGPAVGGVVAELRQPPLGIQLLENVLTFGAVGQGDTAKTSDTITIRSRFAIPATIFSLGNGIRWNVTTSP